MKLNHSKQGSGLFRSSNLDAKTQKKHVGHLNHTGRSMIEMLGVLAVIGVLSIVALVGFTYAMNKHRANETIYDVMLRGTNVPMVDEYYFDKDAGYEFRFPGLVNNGRQGTYYPMVTLKDGGASYYVEATDVTYRVCELILKMNPTDIDQIVVGDTVYTGDSDICGSTDGLAMKFCFGTDGDVCDGTGGSGSGGSSGGSGTGSGSGSGSGDNPDACQPACNACEKCVEGTCVLKTCSILSCPDGQVSMGVDDCGCIIGCKDNCPEFNGCDGCREEIIDENGCRTCSEDQTISKKTGTCCASESGTCCPLTDADCVCTPAETCTCEERGGTTVTIASGSCCNEVVDCCQINEGDCPDSCEPTETNCPVGCGSASLLNPGKTCSDGSEGYWSVEIQGKPSGEADGCCLSCSGEPIPHAFWNGTAGECCFGMPYEDRSGNWGCCNTEDGNWVTKIYGADSGEMCCPQGQNAYVFNEYANPLCCNGEVARQSDGYYSCCSDGYHAFTIVGHPEGDIGMCCHPDYTAAYWHESYGGQCCTGTPMTVATKRHDHEVLYCCKEDQKAYYDGSFKCCTGELYEYDAENYDCCRYDESEKNVLSTIQFANFGSSSPISDKWCCPEGQTAYWTGSEGYGYSAQCCAGEPYMGIDAPECCYSSYPSYDYDTGTEISIQQEVVSVTGIGGVSACCASEENGVPLGGAYFANSYSWMWGARCCYGNIGVVPSGAATPADIDIYPTRTDEVYACCPAGTYVTAATGERESTHYGCCAPGVDYAAYGTTGGVEQYCCPDGTEAKVDNWGDSFCCYPDETAVVWWEPGGYTRRCCPSTAVICPVPDSNHLNCCATGCGENGGCNEDGTAGVGPRT